MCMEKSGELVKKIFSDFKETFLLRYVSTFSWLSIAAPFTGAKRIQWEQNYLKVCP